MKAINPGLTEYLRSIPRNLFFLLDAFAIVAAFLFAYFLRYSFNLDSFILILALKQSLLALLVYLAFEVLFRSFAGLANRTTIQDIFRVFISTTCSVAFLLLITFLGSKLEGQFDLINIPRSILLIHYFSVFVLWSVLRIAFKDKA